MSQIPYLTCCRACSSVTDHKLAVVGIDICEGLVHREVVQSEADVLTGFASYASIP